MFFPLGCYARRMDMARHPRHARRGMRYYLRARVPVDLLGFLGREEIWRSLRTGEHAAAVTRHRRARADLDTSFDQQRRRRDAGERLAGEVPELAANWFRQTDGQSARRDFALVGDLLHSALAETEQELVEL